MMKMLKDVVEKCTEQELKMANKTFPMFASDHEGVAVIEEEMVEANEEMEKLLGLLGAIKANVFDDLNEIAMINARHIKRRAQALACEAIQVAAMAQKYIDSNNQRQENIPEFTQEYADYLAENYGFEKPSWIKETPELKGDREKMAEIFRRLKEEK